MKIVVLGTRGIPNIQGGVETHCQELYPRLVALGCDITLITRRPYTDSNLAEYKGVKLYHHFAPRLKSFEAVVHTFLGVLVARKLNPDILHIHAIGPSLFTPLARMLRLKVIMTHHGPDYDRQKWGLLAKFILKAGEKTGVTFANKVIVISKTIQQLIEKKYNKYDSVLIPNGVTIPITSSNTDYIDSLGLTKKRYVIAVGRLVEEKGFHDLINAWKMLGTNNDYRLVLVGDADHETHYSRHLKKLAADNDVVLTGFIKGEMLNQVFSHARLFVMSSYHEGLPISLLEAMSYNLDAIVSDIPANLEIGLHSSSYFHSGDIKMLSAKIKNALTSPTLPTNVVSLLHDRYDWDVIASETYKQYEELLTKY